MRVKVKVLGDYFTTDHKLIDPVPKRGSVDAAGWDLVSVERVLVPACRHVDYYCGECNAKVALHVSGRAAVHTGIAIEIEPGFEGQVRPRSGLATKKGLTIPNTPGTIDADYRGEVIVNFVNLGGEDQVIEPGDRIAQLLIKEVTPVSFEKVERLSETRRGTGGFGSTGR